MNDYILSCCSTADLSENHFKKRDIHYICFHYSLNGKTYEDDLGKSVPFSKFYQAMADGADTGTSQVNPEEYEDYFRPFLEEGKDILHVCLSSGLSGTINSANIARKKLLREYPQRRIFIEDSLGASSGYGLLMDTLADLRDSGASLEDLLVWTEKHKLQLHHWFFSTDLTSYIKGGRISKTSGWFGTKLGICPLLNMDANGRLVPRKKVRSKKKVIDEMVRMMEQHARGGLSYNGKCYISQAGCPEDAGVVAGKIKELFPNITGDIEINSVGTTIGSHTGPGTVALFFWGDERC
ncbi:MAG: DegV family protein [Eubacteriaceae bacterium]